MTGEVPHSHRMSAGKVCARGGLTGIGTTLRRFYLTASRLISWEGGSARCAASAMGANIGVRSIAVRAAA
jgi:hypothetical protein